MVGTWGRRRKKTWQHSKGRPGAIAPRVGSVWEVAQPAANIGRSGAIPPYNAAPNRALVLASPKLATDGRVATEQKGIRVHYPRLTTGDSMGIMGFIWTVIVGLIIGAIARWIMPGATQTTQLNFRAVRPGESVVQLHYARPWEKAQPPLKEFSVRIRVTAAKSGG